MNTDVQDLERPDHPALNGHILGPFLEEFEIDDAPDFQHWKDSQRARLLPILHTVLAEQIDDYRRRGDGRKMESLAHRLIRIDELSETGVRALLEARAMAGDRIGALRQFERWRERLSNELGATPSSSMDQIADRLRRAEVPRNAPGARTAIATHRPTNRPFVGREAEFAMCYGAWQSTKANLPRHVLVRGDIGVGKTTLVERMATVASLEGAAVARVKCYELEKELPFGVIGGLVAQLLEFPGAAATPPEQLAEIGRLVGRVRDRFANLPDPKPHVGDTSRILFTEGVMALLSSIGEECPIVLAFDDIHLADATSLAILHLILRRLGTAPMMVMLTTSADPRSASPSSRRFVESGVSIGIQEITLQTLSEVESDDLLTTLLSPQSAPAASIRRAFLRGAKGNPMILDMLVADWRRSGDNCLALSLRAMTADTGMPAHDAFRQLVEQTLSSLDRESLAVAELGAILGQRVSDLSMYSLVDLQAGKAMRAVASLTAHKVLREVGPSLEFTNDLVRGQCYLGTPLPLRRMLHGAVADRLLKNEVIGAPIPDLEVAWHLVRADRLEQAVPFLLNGGREAICHAAPHEADLALSTGLPALTGESRRTGILLLAEAKQELGQWADSLQLLDLAPETFSGPEQACRDVYRIIAKRWLGRLSIGDLVVATDQLLEITTADVGVEIQVKAMAACVRLLGLTRNGSQLDSLENVLARINTASTDAATDAFHELHVILARGWICALRHRTSEALALVESGVATSRRAGIASSITVRLLVGQGNLLGMSGRYDDAVAPLEEAWKLAIRLDNTTLAGECASQLAVVSGRLGNVNEQIDWARTALRAFAPGDWSPAGITATYELGLGLASDGRFSEARTAVSLFSTWRIDSVPDWAIQAGFLCEADVAGLTGNIRRAYFLARKATTGSRARLHHVAYAGQFARWVALLGIRDSNEVGAREQLRSEFPSTTYLDRKDEAEVLASITLLDGALGVDTTGTWREVDRRLAGLPESVGKLIKRIGQHTTPFGPSRHAGH
ncbi:MAG TPA: AAA family ATPase [Gemmatimonadales bacterium]